jgi:WD40 repeat protein
MDSDKEQRSKGIVPAGNRGLTRYTSLIDRGLDLAKELDKSEAGLEVSRQPTEIIKPQSVTWKCVHTIKGHSNGVYSVAISPDGQTLASCGEDNTVKIWNLNTGELLRTIPGHSDEIYSVTFSPNGQLLASSSGDKTVKLWNWETGRLLRTLSGHADKVYSVTFSPDGQTLASSSADKTIRIWDLSTGTELHTSSIDLTEFNALKNYNDRTFVTDIIGEAKSWSFSWEPLDLLFQEIYLPLDLLFQKIYLDSILIADEQILVIGDGFRIEFWNLATGELQSCLGNSEIFSNQNSESFSNQYHSLAISPEAKTVAGGCEDGTIKIFEIATGKLLYNLSGHSKSVFSIAFSPDGQMLASGSRDGLVNIWQVFPVAESDAIIRKTQCWSCINTLTEHSNSISSVAVSPNGQILASASWDKTIKLWNLHNGELLRTFNGHSSWVHSVAISPDGKTLVSGSSLNVSNFDSIKVWNLDTGELLHTLGGCGELLAISPDGQTLISSSFTSSTTPDLRIDIWNLQTGEWLRTLSSPSNFIPEDTAVVFLFPISSLAISPDGQTIACGTEDGKIHLWNFYTEQIIHTLTGHLFEVISVNFSPDGHLLASGSEDATVKLWDLKTKRAIRTLPAGSKSMNDLCSVTSVAFSPDGQTLASVSLHTTIWKLSNGERLYTFDESGVVKSLAFSPDGQLLVSGLSNGRIEVWQLSSVIRVGGSDPTLALEEGKLG